MLAQLESNSGYYYIKLPNGEIVIGDKFKLDLFKMCKAGDKVKSLSKVPNYDLWKAVHEQWKVAINENAQLKELLKECELWFTGVVGNMNDKNVGEHNRNLPIGNFEHIFQVFSQKINQVLGDKTDE